MAGRIKEAELEKRREKAKALRYKRPIAVEMNLDHIQTVLWDIQEAAGEIEWMDNDTLSELLGDEEDAMEFKMEFSYLVSDANRLQEDIDNEWIPDCFDEFFPAAGAKGFGGYAGFDSFIGDYFGLEPYEEDMAEKEAEKRIARLSKTELLRAAGICLQVYSSFVALQYRYDCLSSALDIIRGETVERLRVIKDIEEMYKKAEDSSNHFEYKYADDVLTLNKLLDELPQEFWL